MFFRRGARFVALQLIDDGLRQVIERVVYRGVAEEDDVRVVDGVEMVMIDQAAAGGEEFVGHRVGQALISARIIAGRARNRRGSVRLNKHEVVGDRVHVGEAGSRLARSAPRVRRMCP